MNILDAMTDEKLFGRTFRPGALRGDSWQPWRTFLAGLFGLPMDAESFATFQTHTGRDISPTEQFREAYCICGRRSGKSIIAALAATYLAAFRDYSDFLAPGEIGVLPIIAPDRKQCRVILNYIAGFFESSPMLRSKLSTRLKDSIELKNRIRIEVHTASFRTVRGYTAIGAILDEVAFLRSEDSANPASELLAALGPAMSTIPNALLLGISSPYARRGVLWDAYREHYGKSDSPVLVWQADTRSMNPTVSRLVIAAAYLRDRVAAESEYGGQFRSDIESFLDVEIIAQRTIADRRELAYNSAHSYVGFCDPSGGRSDSFTLAIAHTEKGCAVLDCLREVSAPFSPEGTCSEFADTLKRYHLSEVTGDKYAGEWPREQFAKRGVSYRVCDRSKSELYLEFLPLVMSGQVELLDHQRLAVQLSSLERRTARGGKDSVDHPPGAHDDVANAAAGVVVLALADAGALGLISYLSSGQAEKDLKAIGTARPISATESMLRLQAQARGITRHASSLEPEPMPPCPDCNSSALVVKIGGAPYRCNGCGKQFGQLPEVARVNRNNLSQFLNRRI